MLGRFGAAEPWTAWHRCRWESAVAGKFVVRKDAAGGFRFNLVAGNGEVIASSESYTSKASAMSGIQSVKANAPTAPVFDETA